MVWQLSTSHLCRSQALLRIQASLSESTRVSLSSAGQYYKIQCFPQSVQALWEAGGEVIADIPMVVLGRVAQSGSHAPFPKWVSALLPSPSCCVKQSHYESEFGKRRTVSILAVKKMDEDVQSFIVKVSYLVSQKIIMFLQPFYCTQRTKKNPKSFRTTKG